MRDRIDSLQAIRGLAVFVVVLYHCNIVFGGGFVGVDVFFVLSGFVICRSSLVNLSENGSNYVFLRTFFRKRVLRLIPGLCATTIGTVLVSMLVFSPFGELQQILISALSSVLFLANARLFLLNDYTSLTSDPFRHMWSLGVEEQFYLSFPLLILIVLWIAGKSRFSVTLLAFVVCGSVISFGLSVMLAEGMRLTPLPQRFAFYSPVSRAWQIGIGIVIALLEVAVRDKVVRRGAMATCLTAGGLLLILYSSITADALREYPGLNGLTPVLGASALIVASLVSHPYKIFVLKPLVLLGDVSYSLYLVHWPVIVILQRAFSDHLLVRVVSIPIALALAVLQYTFVEKRFFIGRQK